MKTWNIEIQKVKAMAHGHGLIRAQIDALVQPAAPSDVFRNSRRLIGPPARSPDRSSANQGAIRVPTVTPDLRANLTPRP